MNNLSSAQIDYIDNVTAAVRKVAALLRAAEADPQRPDRAWLVGMALEQIEDGERHLPGLNRLDTAEG
jgi:hypothetical protein